MANKNMDEESGYTALAAAIVEQALRDYAMWYKRLLKNPTSNDVIHEIERLMRFFESQWYYELTDLDAAVLIKQVQRNVKSQKEKG